MSGEEQEAVSDIPMKVLDLFCGAGGASVGLEEAEAEVVLNKEIHPRIAKIAIRKSNSRNWIWSFTRGIFGRCMAGLRRSWYNG